MTDFSAITTIENTLNTTIIAGVAKLSPAALGLLTVLGAISIMTKWERYFTGQPFWGELAVKCMQIGFVGWLIKNWYNFYIDYFKNTAESIGATAAGQEKAMTIPGFLSKYVSDIFTLLGNTTASLGILKDGIVLWIICGILLLLSILMLAKIAFTMFMAKYELAVVGGLLVILLPFSVLDYTKEFGNKVWSALFSMFVKLMVVSFFFYLICTMGDQISPIGKAISEGADPEKLKAEVPKLIAHVISLGFLMYLMSAAENIASSLISGATISTGNPIGMVGRGAGAIAGGVAGAATRTVGAVAGRSAIRGTANAGRAIAREVADTGRAVAQAAPSIYRRVRSLFN